MSKTRKALVNDEWIVVVLGFIVLGLSVLFPNVMNSFKIPGILAAQSASALGSLQGWLGAVYIFVFAGSAVSVIGTDRQTVQGYISVVSCDMSADCCLAGIGYNTFLQEVWS